MKTVFGLFYSSCIYESAAGLQSLHTTREGAEIALCDFLKGHASAMQEQNDWLIENGMEHNVTPLELKEYERLYVLEVEVLE